MTADLISRLESAEAGSRELDGAVWYAIYEPDVEHGCLHVEQTEQGPVEVLTCELGSKYADCVGNYTTSLDAALALADRVLVERGPININVCLAGSAQAQIYPVDPCGPHEQAVAATPALALVIATLRAKQGEGE